MAHIRQLEPFYDANSTENRPPSDEIGPGAWKPNTSKRKPKSLTAGGGAWCQALLARYKHQAWQPTPIPGTCYLSAQPGQAKH